MLNSDVELAPDYLRSSSPRVDAAGSPPARFWRRTIRPHRRHLRPDLPRRHGLARGQRAGRRAGVRPAARRIWSAPWTAALFRAELFRQVGPAGGELRIVPGGCGFRLALRGAGAGGRVCAGGRGLAPGSATLGRWHPETVRRIARNQVLLVARHYPRPTCCVAGLAHRWWRSFCGARWRCGMARAWPGARQSGRACASFPQARRDAAPVTIQNYWNGLCDQRAIDPRRCRRPAVRFLLEAVFSAHRRWGKVTHEQTSASSSSPITRRARSAPAWMPPGALGRRNRGGG